MSGAHTQGMGMICSMHLVSADDIALYRNGIISAKDFLTKVMKDDTPITYLDKAWQIIHFGLSGEEWDCNDMLGTAIMGGEELLGTESGTRLLDPDLVAAVANTLDMIHKTEFRKLLLSRNLEDAELYCFDFDNREDDADYAADHYGNLREAYLKAAREGCGAIISIG